MAQSKTEMSLNAKLKKIEFLLFDVDGVLTDGSMYFTSNQYEMKVFHALDGLGIVMAKRAGLRVGFVTARSSKVVDERAKELKLDVLIQGSLNKAQAMSLISKKFKVNEACISYMGDDLIDIPILKRAGLAVAVANAVPEVKKICDFITQKKGGSGAVREVIELILKVQGKWKSLVEEMS